MVASISIISSLLPIVFFILFCLKTNIRGLWVIFFYCLASLLSDIFLGVGWGLHHQYFIWNAYTLVEYLLLVYFFYVTIKLRLIRSLIIIISVAYFITFLLLNKGTNNQFNSVLSFISQLIILALCLIYILSSMAQISESINILSPSFLIVIGILLYVACTLFLFIIANQLTEEQKNKYWGITYYSNLLTNLLFSTAFLLYRYQNKKLPPESHNVDFTSPNDR